MANLGANLGANPARILRSLAVVVIAAGLLGACASSSGSDRQLAYAPSARVASSQVGTASWYGDKFHGRRTASGERYNMHALTAAHRSLPFGTKVRVINLENNHRVIVTINDRGPFVKGRVIDVSKRAADMLGMRRAGVASVRIEVLQSAGG